MARLVKRTATAPLKVEIGGEAKWICACGLSKNQPFCDGSHKAAAAAEAGGKLCWYDAEGKATEVPDGFPGIRTW